MKLGDTHGGSLERDDDPFFRKPRPELLPNGDPGTPYELLGFYVHPGDGHHVRPHLAVMTRHFWEFLHNPEWCKYDSAEDRGRIVAKFEQWLNAAKIAERKNDTRRLKEISDQVRQELGEIPTVIPPGGFEDVDHFPYKGRLTANEIEARIVESMSRRGWLEFFVLACANQKGNQ